MLPLEFIPEGYPISFDFGRHCSHLDPAEAGRRPLAPTLFRGRSPDLYVGTATFLSAQKSTMEFGLSSPCHFYMVKSDYPTCLDDYILGLYKGLVKSLILRGWRR